MILYANPLSPYGAGTIFEAMSSNRSVEIVALNTVTDYIQFFRIFRTLTSPLLFSRGRVYTNSFEICNVISGQRRSSRDGNFEISIRKFIDVPQFWLFVASRIARDSLSQRIIEDCLLFLNNNSSLISSLKHSYRAFPVECYNGLVFFLARALLINSKAASLNFANRQTIKKLATTTSHTVSGYLVHEIDSKIDLKSNLLFHPRFAANGHRPLLCIKKSTLTECLNMDIIKIARGQQWLRQQT